MSVPEKRLSSLVSELQTCREDFENARIEHIRKCYPNQKDGTTPEGTALFENFPDAISSRVLAEKAKISTAELVVYFLGLFCECQEVGKRLESLKPKFSGYIKWKKEVDSTRALLIGLLNHFNNIKLQVHEIALRTHGICEARFAPLVLKKFDGSNELPDAEYLYDIFALAGSYQMLADVLQNNDLAPDLWGAFAKSASLTRKYYEHQYEKLWPSESLSLDEDIRRSRYDQFNLFVKIDNNKNDE